MRAGEQFLARGRVHRRKTHPVRMLAFFYFILQREKGNRLAPAGAVQARNRRSRLLASRSPFRRTPPNGRQQSLSQKSMIFASSLCTREPLFRSPFRRNKNNVPLGVGSHGPKVASSGASSDSSNNSINKPNLYVNIFIRNIKRKPHSPPMLIALVQRPKRSP